VVKDWVSRGVLVTLGVLACQPASAQEVGLAELLDLDLDQLARITVTTASKRPQVASRVPATVRVVTARQIRERGYQSIEEALSDLPGIQLRNILGFNSYVFMRGAPSQNNLMLLMVDGVQLNELSSGGFYGGHQLDLANVKQIEVVYGPASALYGTNAVSGIINVITFDPQDRPGTRARVLFGSFDTVHADAGYSWYDKERDLGLSASAMYSRTDKARLGGKAGDNNWSVDMESFEKDASFEGKLQYRDLSLGVLLQDKRASRSTNYRATGTPYLDRGSEWHIRFTNLYLGHAYDTPESWSLESRLYYRSTDVVDDTVAYVSAEPGVGQVGYSRPSHLLGVESVLLCEPRPGLEVVLGAVWERERLAEDFSVTTSGSPDLPPPRPPDPPFLTDQLLSGFLQAQYRLRRFMELTLGVRHDSSSYYGSVTTPRIGLVYDDQQVTAKLLWTEAFRAPKPWDLSFGAGNPSLEPEEMESFELAFGHRLSETFRLDASVYRNRLSNLFTTAGSTDGPRWVNSGRLDTDGVELGLYATGNRFRSSLSYTFTDSRLDDGSPVPEIARHGAHLGLALELTPRARLDLRASYLGDRPNNRMGVGRTQAFNRVITATGSDEVESAVVAHATLSVTSVGPFTLRLMMRNLFDTEYYHTSNRPPERYRQPQRSFFLEVEYVLP
jgi:outer membrane cobalamin receptor